MIVDLFSHKIHSSGDDWPEKLAELASIFGEFEGQVFDRQAFETRLQKISPRASYLANTGNMRTPGGRLDPSKFRDEISAYPAYLGLYYLAQSSKGWVVKISETAKHFLLREEPDVPSFLRLQLPLFQYPNAMGAAYRSFSNSLRIQANTCNRSLSLINDGVHFSPVRLIAVALKADAAVRNVDILTSSVKFSEIFGLANSSIVNQHALPPIDKVIEILTNIRNGKISCPRKYESRFHTLRHTELFILERGEVKLRRCVNKLDQQLVLNQLNAITSISAQFNLFDSCKSAQDIEKVIASGVWGEYFDGLKILPANIVDVLTKDTALDLSHGVALSADEKSVEPVILEKPETYPLRERYDAPAPIRPFNRARELADPEATKIKRQKRNLAHKELVAKMDDWLRSLGAIPKENDHIDLFAKIPKDGSFIFEMKSGGDSLLEQIRKGLSQLYEYRFRYKDVINDDHISLCLVLPENPTSFPWLTTYLCEDREISICWFENDGKLTWPNQCAKEMQVLSN